MKVLQMGSATLRAIKSGIIAVFQSVPVAGRLVSCTDAAVIQDSGVTVLDAAAALEASLGVFDGICLDSPSVTVASAGGVITLSVEKSGGGDVRYVTSGGPTATGIRSSRSRCSS